MVLAGRLLGDHPQVGVLPGWGREGLPALGPDTAGQRRPAAGEAEPRGHCDLGGACHLVGEHSDGHIQGFPCVTDSRGAGCFWDTVKDDI